MTMLLLVRHAKTNEMETRLCGRESGIGLNTEGLEQADRLARHLTRLAIEAVFSSPLRRAQQTADRIARGFDCTVRTDDRIDEIDFGEWAGRSFSELAQDERFARWNATRAEGRAPAGESMREVQARAMDFIDEATIAAPKSTLVVVSHGDVIRAAVCRVIGLSLNCYDRFAIDPASITALIARHGRLELLRLNEVAYA